jgi:parvulin-like peptidyl-prolyl isomerase
MKKVVLVIILLLLTTNFSLSKLVDYIVAVVNSEPITMSMVEEAMSAIWVDASSRPKTPEDAIQKLIDYKLKLQEARRRGIFVTEDELSTEIARVSSRFASSEQLANLLEQYGMTLDDLKANLTEEIKIQKMIERKFGQFIRDSDLEGEATNYFEQHKSDFIIPESVLLDQISFKLESNSLDEIAKENTRKKAEEVLNNLKSGASFSKYANDWKTSYINVNELSPSITEAIKLMNIGEISNIIETPEGYFIIKLNDRRLPRQAIFSEVKEQIISQLRQKEIEAELQADLKKQRENADIRINYPVKGKG